MEDELMVCDECGWTGPQSDTEEQYLADKEDFVWLCPDCGGTCGNAE